MTTWMTVEQATEYVGGKDKRILTQAIRDGELPAYTWGQKQMRVSTDDVDAWMKSKPFNG
jgi:excisionase family DNA binding protein